MLNKLFIFNDFIDLLLDKVFKISLSFFILILLVDIFKLIMMLLVVIVDVIIFELMFFSLFYDIFNIFR